VSVYEAMVILPDRLTEDEIEKGLDSLKSEIKSLGGTVQAATRMGKKNFARKLNKQSTGEYALVTFSGTGNLSGQLQERLKHNESIFRIQVVRLPEPARAN